MSLSNLYPNVERLCISQCTSLDTLSHPITKEDELFNLAGCCWWINQGNSPTSNAADPFSYLQTLEKFLDLFPGVDQKKLWKKLQLGSLTSSEFLDTISELSMSIFYHENGHKVEIEKPLNPQIRNGKDADIFLKCNTGLEIWLDVLSFRPQFDNGMTEYSPHPSRSQEEVITLFESRISGKFISKFKEALANGKLSPPNAGVILCMLKAEEFLVSLPTVLLLKQSVRFSSDFLKQCPGMSYAVVVTLRKDEASDYLKPVFVCEL
jgi:hypothetical protein